MRASLRRNGLRVGLLALMTLTACGDDTAASGGNSSGAGGSGGAGGTGAGGGGGAGPTGVNIPELSAEVAATYDEHGLLHLACASDDDHLIKLVDSCREQQRAYGGTLWRQAASRAVAGAD